MSSSVAGRPNCRDKSVSHTRVLTWYSKGYWGFAMFVLTLIAEYYDLWVFAASYGFGSSIMLRKSISAC